MLTNLLALLLYSVIVVIGLTAYKHGSNLYRAGRRRPGMLFVGIAFACQGLSFLVMILLVGRVAVPTIIAGVAGLNIMLLTLVSARALKEALGARVALANVAIVVGIVLMTLEP